MAIFWEHIKGEFGTDSSSLVKTEIRFQGTRGLAPRIWSYDLKDTSSSYTDLGCILTEKADNQKIYKDITITANDTSLGGSKIYFLDTNNYIYGDTNNLYLNAKGEIRTTSNCRLNGKTDLNTLTVHGKTILEDNLTITGGKSLTVGTATTVSAEKIEAPYFNATSDYRAKENIEPFNQSALNIINSLPTYTYTYKDSGIKSYGVMAQDLENVDINGFSFVGNPTATGENHDYMSVHETKLIYLLIEGMREQQKEIEALKSQLEAFTNGK